MKMADTRINMNRIITTGRIAGIAENKVQAEKYSTGRGPAFQEILQDALSKDRDIRFSKHAVDRMEKRNIVLSPLELRKMMEAVDKANEKGIRDSLVLMDNTAFVVNIPSRTVITAVDGENMKENIFTNIDGAVIL